MLISMHTLKLQFLMHYVKSQNTRIFTVILCFIQSKIFITNHMSTNVDNMFR